jgi:hypothetical protein
MLRMSVRIGPFQKFTINVCIITQNRQGRPKILATEPNHRHYYTGNNCYMTDIRYTLAPITTA